MKPKKKSKRGVTVKVMLGTLLVCVAAVVAKEVPALRRYLKIESM